MDFNSLDKKFTENRARQLNPLVLAFVGDAVYENFVRIYLTDKYDTMTVNKLHIKAIEFVKAHAQSEFMKKIYDDLNEDEKYIYKRGRNAKSGTSPKNADICEYRTATGFEALIGYLYITDKMERVNFILEKIVDIKEQQDKIGR
ncbi:MULTISPECIES: Mini-ribonuclease 3 [Clostridium]|uniref:Mini-ribonuclease 3 n=1 Tax=Clostridium TaxID=1485 RepID=UPI00082575CE|nr:MULTISPECIES: Mini-ribonuclease 3 [Clostridium]PJI08855.1 Mini-ribonuclease 3 [Clostridium sp. CT7]